MADDDVLTAIEALNSAQFGSLGEKIVEAYYRKQGHTVLWMHKGFIDLKIDGEPIDVKARRNFGQPIDHSHISYRGKRKANIGYIQINFFDDQVVISDDHGLVVKLPWTDIHVWQYLNNKTPTSRKSGTTKLTTKRTIGAEIRSWYHAATEKKIYIFQRGPATDTFTSTGDSIPDNSYPTPKRLKEYCAQVFLRSDENDNLEYIIAFPHEHLNKLPQAKPSQRQLDKGITNVLNMTKIYKHQKEYVFVTFESLKREYFVRFPWSTSSSDQVLSEPR